MQNAAQLNTNRKIRSRKAITHVFKPMSRVATRKIVVGAKTAWVKLEQDTVISTYIEL